MTRFTILASLVILAAFSPGCAQGGGSTPDAGGGMVRVDGGPPRDSGPRDAGRRTDGGEFTPDAGRVDGGRRDAGGTDAGSVCTESPCRLIAPQCGCSGGQACYLTASGRSCETAGSAGEGTPCSNPTDCQGGMTCDIHGICARMCDSDADCPGRGSVCENSVSAGGMTVGTCTIPCEPADSTGCPSGMACRIYDDYTDCATPGSVAPQGTCSSTDECTAEYTCVTVSNTKCRRLCRDPGLPPTVGSPDCPEIPFSCTAFVIGAPTVDGHEYGFCTVL